MPERTNRSSITARDAGSTFGRVLYAIAMVALVGLWAGFWATIALVNLAHGDYVATVAGPLLMVGPAILILAWVLRSTFDLDWSVVPG